MFNHASPSGWFGRSAVVAALATGLLGFFSGAGAADDDARSTTPEPATCCAGGGLSGVWTGEYRYPDGSGMRPVTFTVFLFQQGDRVTAMIKEPNTFGDQTSPWLHATADGRFDTNAKTLDFVKSYDGTGGQNHDVVYKGTLSSGATETVSGTWDISGLKGSFTMKKKNCCD